MLYKHAAILYRAVRNTKDLFKIFDPSTIKDRTLKIRGLYFAPNREVAERWGVTLWGQKTPFEIHKFYVPDDILALGARDGFYSHPAYKEMMKLKVDRVGELLKDKQIATGIKRVTGLDKRPMEIESLPEIVVKEKDVHKIKHLGRV